MKKNKIIFITIFIILINGCVNVPQPSKNERISGVSISDYKFLKSARSFSYYNNLELKNSVEVSSFNKKNIKKNKVEFSIFLSQSEEVCLREKKIDLYELIKKTIPDKDWYILNDDVSIELVYTKEVNFDISEFFIEEPRFYFHLESCGNRSTSSLKSLIIESIATVFHELVHANSDASYYTSTPEGVLEEEVIASSIGICVKLLSKSVKAYRFNNPDNKTLLFYKKKFKNNQVFYRSILGEVIAEDQFFRNLGDKDGYVNTKSQRKAILYECTSIFNSAYSKQLTSK